MKRIYISLLALCSAFTLTANETISDSIVNELEMDTIAVTDSVAPEVVIIGEDTFPAPPMPVHLEMKSIRKAALAASCPTDSIVGLDTVGNYVSKEEFKYDEAGHTIEYAKYSWDKGVKKGEQHYRKSYTGNIVTVEVNFAWDATSGSWIGKDSTQQLYSGTTNIGKQKFVWENNVWRLQEQYDYEFNSHKDRTLTQFSKWNVTAQAVLPSYKYVYEYDAQWRNIDEQQWNYKYGTGWEGYSRTRKEYAADGHVQVLETYKGWENNDWKGTSKTETIITKAGNTETTDELTYEWKSGWVGKTKKTTIKVTESSKTSTDVLNYDWLNNTWTGKNRSLTVDITTGTGKSTSKSSYSWSDKWVGIDSTYQEWSGSNLIDDIKYKWANNAWEGVSRASAKWNGGKQTEIYSYQWSGSAWVDDVWTQLEYTGNNVTKEFSQKMNVETSVWEKYYKIETTYNSSNNITYQLESQGYNDSWVDVKETKNEYSGTLPTSETVREWNGTELANKSRTLYEYGYKDLNTLKVIQAGDGSGWASTDSIRHEKTFATISGKEKEMEDIQTKWTSSSNKWVGTSRTTYEYDAAANQIEKYTYKYSNNDNAWVYNQRTQNLYKDNNPSLNILNASWTWTNNAWKGNTKYEYEFDETNRKVSTARYTWDANKGTWKGAEKSKDVYKNDLKVQDFSYTWNSSKSDWDGMFRHDYSYDDKKRQIEYVQFEFNTDWVPSKQQLDYFDDTHSTSVITEINVWRNNDWCPSSYKETSYDETGDKRQRFILDITYNTSNCGQITKYDYKQYYYNCDQYYLIRFVNDDDSELEAMNVLEGQTPSYDFSEKGVPAKAADQQYTYTFKNWDKTIVPATNDAVYKATYNATPRKYQVTFYNEDKTTIIESKTWEYNAVPTCTEPIKSSDAQYTYTFKNWGDGVKPVTGDTSYIAVFDTTINRYAVDFYNEEVFILRDSVAYGEVPVYTGVEPIKTGDAQYSYSFSGWNNPLVAVTGDAIYKATFTQSVNKYTVIFYDENGTTELEHKEWSYGDIPSYSGSEPTKTGDAQYSYSFSGWTPTIVTVTGAATYTATFTSELNKYDISFEVKEHSEMSYTLPDVDYGTLISTLVDAVKAALGGETFEDEQYIYTFAGLENVPSTEVVHGNATYYVLYTKQEKTPTDINQVETENASSKKYFRNGVLYIERNGNKYSVTGEKLD